MKALFRKLRGLLGLGIVGGVAGGLFGAFWGLLEILVLSPDLRPQFLFYMAGWGVVGAMATTGFGLLLTTTSGRRRLEDVSPWRARLLGAVAGAAGPAVLHFLVPSVFLPGAIGLLVAAVGSVVGAGLASAMIAVAKTAPDAPELVPDRDNPLLESGSRP